MEKAQQRLRPQQCDEKGDNPQNPPRCQSIEELGSCLENWLSKKRQYEEFSDADGVPCKVSDDSLMAALFQLMPSSLEETVMFKSDAFATFDALFDRLSSFATTRHRSDFQERHRFRRSPQEERSRCHGCESLEQGQGQGPGFQQDSNVLQVQQAGSQSCRMSDRFPAEGLGQRQGQLSVG